MCQNTRCENQLELHHEDRHRREVRTRRGAGRARVVVHRHVEVGARGPDRVVVGREQRRELRVGRHAGKQDAAEEAVLARPLDLGHRVVDVVQEDLRHAGAPARRVGAEVGEPPVVRLQPGPPVARTGRSRAAGRGGCPTGRTAGWCSGRSPRRRRRRPRARCRRAFESQFRYAVSPRRSTKGFTYDFAHSSNSSRYFDSR